MRPLLQLALPPGAENATGKTPEPRVGSEPEAEGTAASAEG